MMTADENLTPATVVIFNALAGFYRQEEDTHNE